MPKLLSDLRRLPRGQLKSINKDELIDSIMASTDSDDVALQYVTEKLNEVMQELAQVRTALTSAESPINKRVTELQQQVNMQSDIIARQQRYLEILDRKERECNLVLLGVPEDGENIENATVDVDKIEKIWRVIGSSVNITSNKRLGQQGPRRRRPILITVESRRNRDAVLEKAKILKQSDTEIFRKIFIKKDIHPSVRAEWKRLRDAEKTEKERPENVGCNIVFNSKERQLYKDGVVIDKWSLMGF